ncbi:MAG: polyphenol oxidase family protein [Spirochaetales bacterium]|nr:polyphenol oxidase family protein [Spirochaetales bacterium]
MTLQKKGHFTFYRWNILNDAGVTAFTAAGVNTALHAPGSDSQATILENRRQLSMAAGISERDWICADQVHGNSSLLCSRQDRGRGALSAETAAAETDALILGEAGLQGMIFTADCLPVILYDTEQHIGALIHAGWRGAAAGIVPAVLDRMTGEAGCSIHRILAAAGPVIDACCNQVDAPVYQAMTSAYPETTAAFTPDGEAHWRFSLEKAVFLQLASRGMEESQMEGSGLCSCCHTELSSWRREGKSAGRMATCLILE